jgi:hypothetical protein
MDGNLAMNAHFENMSEENMNDMHDHFSQLLKQKSVAFLEWAYGKGYRRFMVKGDGECHWQRDQKGDLATGQVYQLFESESKK